MSSLCNSRIKNTVKTIQYSKKLNRQEQTLAQPVILGNAFFAHPDELLLAMGSDAGEISIKFFTICYNSEKKLQGQYTWSQITKSWNQQYSCDSDNSESEISEEIMHRNIRKVINPKLNLNAKSYKEIVHLNLLVSEPPF